jgi:hypothetical protein
MSNREQYQQALEALDPTFLYECPMCHEPTLWVNSMGRLWCTRLVCGFLAFERAYPLEELHKTEQLNLEE